MNQQTTRLTNTELAGILRRGFGGALGRKEQILAYDAHCLLASEAIETLETENTLLSACLVKAEKQRDTLLAALKDVLAQFVDPQQGIDQFDSAIVRKVVERAGRAIAAVESGKVPS